MLSGHAQKIICVDVTREMLSLAARENRMDNMCYLMIDGINLPVKGCSVNSILSVCVLQYAARNQDIYRSIMSEFKRVLKPGGSIFALEQVSFADAGQLLPECSLRIKDYLGEMEKYFHIKHAHPVRGARKRSFFEKLAIKYRLPEALFPLLTWMDINRTKKLTPAQLAQYPYVDYFFLRRFKRIAPCRPDGSAHGAH